MIEFIICEDEKDFRVRYEQISEQVMMNYDLEYKINSYSEYSSKWKQQINSNSFKIFILDFHINKTEDYIVISCH